MTHFVNVLFDSLSDVLDHHQKQLLWRRPLVFTISLLLLFELLLFLLLPLRRHFLLMSQRCLLSLELRDGFHIFLRYVGQLLLDKSLLLLPLLFLDTLLSV